MTVTVTVTVTVTATLTVTVTVTVIVTFTVTVTVTASFSSVSLPLKRSPSLVLESEKGEEEGRPHPSQTLPHQVCQKFLRVEFCGNIFGTQTLGSQTPPAFSKTSLRSPHLSTTLHLFGLAVGLDQALIKTEYWDRAGGGGNISYDW